MAALNPQNRIREMQLQLNKLKAENDALRAQLEQQGNVERSSASSGSGSSNAPTQAAPRPASSSSSSGSSSSARKVGASAPQFGSHLRSSSSAAPAPAKPWKPTPTRG